jgi:NADH-quinone oxidoreductase subunit J
MTFLIINYFLKDLLLDFYYLLIFFMLHILILNALLSLLINNPIYSILFLILAFVSFGALLFLLGLQLVGFLLLIVYIGGISILLLFVLMLLNIRFLLFEKKYSFSLILSVLFCILILEVFFFCYSGQILVHLPLYTYVDWAKILYVQDPLFVLGIVLYENYRISIILCGLLLLTVMLSSISVIIFKKKIKNQILFQQLKVDKINLIFFK